MIEQKDYKNFASKDTTRKHLNYANIIANKAYFTDGHRMLTLNNANLDDGVYCPKTLEMVNTNQPYQQVAKLSPSLTGAIQITVKIPLMFKYLKTTLATGTLSVFLDFDGRFQFNKPVDYLTCLNPTFLRELGGETVEINIIDKLSPIVISTSEQEILIMPRRA